MTNFHFQGCSFPSREMHYKCLGSWKASDGQNYLALMDTELPQLGEEIRPRYRCGVSPLSSSYSITSSVFCLLLLEQLRITTALFYLDILHIYLFHNLILSKCTYPLGRWWDEYLFYISSSYPFATLSYLILLECPC